MAEELDIQLRYVGKRFDGARLPLDVLADLPAFRDLVVAFAKELWRTENADRQRVPKGFDQSMTFDLTSIQDGSAIPKLTWDRETAQSRLPGFADELQSLVNEAYEQIISLIDDAANGIFPKALTSEHVRALNRFGSSLRDQERIEFVGTHDKSGNVVYLDGARRKNLITKVRETYVSRLEGTGTLIGTFAPNDQPLGRLTVDTQAYGAIEIAVDRERIIKEFDGNIGGQVQFELAIELDNNDNYRSVVELHGLTLIDDQIAADLARCTDRLHEISALKDGWDDEGGRAISQSARDAALAFLHKRPVMSGCYMIFPTRDGGVLFEFEKNGWDLSVEFSADGAVEFFGIEIDGDGELPPTHFDRVDEQFIEQFDKHAGRDGR
jgi:hypothetical protein